MKKEISSSVKNSNCAKDVVLEGAQYKNHAAEKTATNNQWTSDNQFSTEGTQYNNRNKAEKTATDNQWVSRNQPDDSILK